VEVGVTIPDEPRMVVTYRLKGHEFTEVLDKLLGIRGELAAQMTIQQLEKLYLDLGYYRSTLMFAAEEMTEYMLDERDDWIEWMAEKRQEARRECRLDRVAAKGKKVTLEGLTMQELEDWIVVKYKVEYRDRVRRMEKAKSDVTFLRSLLEEIDQKRTQYKAVISNRSERVLK